MNKKGMVFNYNPFPPIIGKKSGRDGQVVQGVERPIWQVKQRWASDSIPIRVGFQKTFITKNGAKNFAPFL
jgi:hypothetical protein